jgi:general secretion pathway protein G
MNRPVRKCRGQKLRCAASRIPVATPSAGSAMRDHPLSQRGEGRDSFYSRVSWVSRSDTNTENKAPSLGSQRRKSALPGSEAGFTFLEMIAAMAIMILLASVALPLASMRAQRLKEEELRRDLRDMRTAIDHYKDLSDQGLIPVEPDTFGYPPDLETLVKGVEVKGATGDVRYKFLRKIPVDPMTGSTDWGLRSMQDDPDSDMWGGENVFNVYSKSQGTGLDGTLYSSW